MEWRGAQLNGCQYTHGMVHCVEYTGVPLRVLLDEAGVQAEREVAARRRRRLRRDDALDPARQGARRLPRRLSHERRDAAPRAGLSGAARGAGLGRQCLGEVAAAPEARRRAVVRARGDLEIHRPDGERQSAPVHLRDGREVGHHLAVAAGAAAAQGLHGDLRARLVRARQDRARRCLARRRQELARGEARRARARQGGDALLRRDRMDRRRSCCCSRARSTRPATCSRPRRSCARCAASTRSITTTASRPGS